MASLNRVSLIGNVGRDPEVKFFPSGDKVVNFSLATTETWNDKSGVKQERTEWHRVEVTGKTADVVEKYVEKGTPIYVEGSIAYQEWNDKDGNKRSTTKIKVGFTGRILLLGGKKKGAQPQADGDGGEEQTTPKTATDKNGDDVPF